MAIFDDSRGAWNARRPLRANTNVPWSQRTGVSWHWIGPGKGPSAAGSHQKCFDRVRDWQLMHQGKGWKDIGYNVLICQHGRAIEGRGLTVSGSHSPGVNYAHLGVQFMVGEGDARPSAAMLARAVRLRADLGRLGSNIRRDWSHKDDPEASTACAGPWITSWVHGGGPTKSTSGSGGGSSSPIPTPKPTPVEDDMPSAEEIAKAVWAHEVPIPNNDPRPAGTTLGGANRNAWIAAKGVDVAAITKALVAALPADATVNVNDLAKAIVLELGKDT